MCCLISFHPPLPKSLIFDVVSLPPPDLAGRGGFWLPLPLPQNSQFWGRKKTLTRNWELGGEQA